MVPRMTPHRPSAVRTMWPGTPRDGILPMGGNGREEVGAGRSQLAQATALLRGAVQKSLRSVHRGSRWQVEPDRETVGSAPGLWASRPIDGAFRAAVQARP